MTSSARWYYGPGGPGDAEGDLAACRGRGALPICLVALNTNGDVLGTAALKTESVGGEIGAGPWLAALLVGKDHRGKGCGHGDRRGDRAGGAPPWVRIYLSSLSG